MPGFLLHVGASVQCFHAAPATASTTNVRVFVGGTPAVTATNVCTVAGCPFAVGPKPQPCVTIRWMPATRVFVNGQPAVVQIPGPAQGICQSAEQIPQGLPIVSAIQTRVIGM
jgi:hypothetical protein